LLFRCHLTACSIEMAAGRSSSSPTFGSEARSPKRNAGNSSSTCSLEGQNDLLQFLKVVKPDWSFPRRKGHSDVRRVVDKLKAIGVTSTWELLQGVMRNTINEDLASAGYSVFSKDTLDSMRKRISFFRQLDVLTESNFRQTGPFAPVPQMLSKQKLADLSKMDRQEKPQEPSGDSDELRPSSSQSRMSKSSRTAKATLQVPARKHHSMVELGSTSSAGGPAEPGLALSLHSLSYSGSLGGSVNVSSEMLSPELQRPRLRGARNSSRAKSREHGPPEEVPLTGVARIVAERNERANALLHRPSTAGTIQAPVEDSPALGPVPSPLEAAQRAANAETQAERQRVVAMTVKSQTLQRPATSAGGDRSAALRNSGMSMNASAPSRHSLTAGSISAAAAKGLVSPAALMATSQRAPAPAPAPQLATTPCAASSSSAAGYGAPSVAESVAPDWQDGGLLATRVQHIMEAGANMRSDFRSARWSVLKSDPDALLDHGQAVMEEQSAIAERKRLYKIMEMEGLVSPMRHHVAGNINHRLQQEAERNAAEGLQMQHRYTNITKQLTLMNNARRDLTSLRKAVSGEDPAIMAAHTVMRSGMM